MKEQQVNLILKIDSNDVQSHMDTIKDNFEVRLVVSTDELNKINYYENNSLRDNDDESLDYMSF